MKILFLTKHFYPNIGGVEKHALEVSKNLVKRGHEVTVLTSKIEGVRKFSVSNIDLLHIEYPKRKLIGLLSIWLWMIKNKSLFASFDILHVHDVGIWIWPLRLLFGRRFFITFHGYEKYPPTFLSKIIRKISETVAEGNICVGDYLKKWYGTRPSLVTYGAAHKGKGKKEKGLAVYLGRLDKGTNLPAFLEKLGERKDIAEVVFVGDGELREVCMRYGKVTGFRSPDEFLKKAEICFASGYLSATEALSFGCKLEVGWTNPLQEDYWKMSPFYRFSGKNSARGTNWARKQTWEKLTGQYLKLWEN